MGCDVSVEPILEITKESSLSGNSLISVVNLYS